MAKRKLHKCIKKLSYICFLAPKQNGEFTLSTKQNGEFTLSTKQNGAFALPPNLHLK